MNNILRTNFSGDQNLGLYGFATDKYCFLGIPGKKIKPVLGVPVYMCPILNTYFSGIFVAGNSQGIVISKPVKDYDMHRLRQHFKNILVLKTKYNALGNLILMNDNGAIISPLLKKNRHEIKHFFGLNCEVSTIAKQRIAGNLGLATNKGCLLHPKVRQYEKKVIEDVLGVSSDIGTVNFGSPYPGAGMLANTNGVVVSERTSGPELGRIAEVFGFV
jgi:translation initiation factor 6